MDGFDRQRKISSRPTDRPTVQTNRDGDVVSNSVAILELLGLFDLIYYISRITSSLSTMPTSVSLALTEGPDRHSCQ